MLNTPSTDDSIHRHAFYAQLLSKVECLEAVVEDSMSVLGRHQEVQDDHLQVLETNDIESRTTMKVARIALLGAWLMFSGIIGWAWNDGVDTINDYAERVDTLEADIEELTRAQNKNNRQIQQMIILNEANTGGTKL